MFNTKGFSIISVLILSSVGALLALGVATLVLQANKRNKSLELRGDVSSAVTSIEFAMSSANNCQSDLLPNINPPRNINLNGPSVAAGQVLTIRRLTLNGTVLAEPNLELAVAPQVIVSRISISNIVLVGVNRFMADLTLEFQRSPNSNSGFINRNIVMPIQLETVGNGNSRNIVNCAVVGPAGQSAQNYIDYMRESCSDRGGTFSATNLSCTFSNPGSQCPPGQVANGLRANWQPNCVSN